MSEITVAIVEDNEAVRDALSELLNVVGYSCREFEDAETFLCSLEAHRWSCLVTDLRMPGMSGADLQQRLRESGSDLPVIVITSAPDATTRRRVMADGAEAYLLKPIADNVLLDHIASAIRKRPSPGCGERQPEASGG